MGDLAGPLDIPRAVTQFHSSEGLQADRHKYEQERIARIHAHNERN